MSRFKFSNVELLRLRNRLTLFKKYLPTLKLRKALLMDQLNKVRAEIVLAQDHFIKKKEMVMQSRHLLIEPTPSKWRDGYIIAEIFIDRESIAGIDLPLFKDIRFKSFDRSPFDPPFVERLLTMMREMIIAFESLNILKDRESTIAIEMRKASIRVNLFEKRMIPSLEKDIVKIKVFLNDQLLQAVCQSKICKKKTLLRGNLCK